MIGKFPLWLLGAVLLAAAPAVAQPDYRARLPQDDVIYFLLPDRFENGDTSNDLGGFPGGRLPVEGVPSATCGPRHRRSSDPAA